MHMRPTKVIPRVRDLSPGIQPHVLDVTPVTLPVEDPQACYPPADRPVENCQSSSGKRTLHLQTVLVSHFKVQTD